MRQVPFGAFVPLWRNFKKSSASNLYLLNPSNGPFTNLQAPLISSLSDIYLNSSEAVYSRVDSPIMARNIFIPSGVSLSSSTEQDIWIWCDTLTLGGNFFGTWNIDATNSTPGGDGYLTNIAPCQCCCPPEYVPAGGAGAQGALGGGGGGGNASPYSADTYGGSGISLSPISGYTGGNGSGSGGSPGGTGGFGNSSSLSAELYPTGLALPYGGNSGDGLQGQPGVGASGSGGGVSTNIIGSGGGGGAAGGRIIICARVVTQTGTGGGLAATGSAGGAGYAGGNNGYAGGGGVISVYAQKCNTTWTISTAGGDCTATAGNWWFTEINHAGTALGTRHVNTQANWDNT